MSDQLDAKIGEAMKDQEYDAILAVGVDNFVYLAQVVPPFSANYPDRKAVVVRAANGEKHVVCPFDWAEAIGKQGWEGRITTYGENEALPPTASGSAVSRVLSDLGLDGSRIGVDTSRASELFMRLLARELPAMEWGSCDEMLKKLRILKTQDEVELLETAANQSEKGIISALNHLEGTSDALGYTIPEFSERIRVHIGEFGGSGVGHLATMQGSSAQLYYAPQRGRFDNGNLVRMDVTNHYRGYWSSAGRMAVIGNPDQGQARAYADNLALKAVAEDKLRPGMRCSEVVEAVERASRAEGVRLWSQVGIGHGLGVSQRESPYLGRRDTSQLESGMVLVLDICTFGPYQELIHSQDTYLIVEGGSRKLSWYRAWDEPYRVTGFRARH